MKDLMIDIETLSTRQNACVMTIGAIKFDRHAKETRSLNEYKRCSNTFYERITIESCKNLNLDIDEDTMKWWGSQSKTAQYEIFEHKDRVTIDVALKKLKEFARGCTHVWSQGSFDTVILEEVYKRCGIEKPWKFWNVRDTRTLFDLADVDLKKIKVDGCEAHNALDDCYIQLVGVHHALQKLRPT